MERKFQDHDYVVINKNNYNNIKYAKILSFDEKSLKYRVYIKRNRLKSEKLELFEKELGHAYPKMLYFGIAGNYQTKIVSSYLEEKTERASGWGGIENLSKKQKSGFFSKFLAQINLHNIYYFLGICGFLIGCIIWLNKNI